jgi:hypothetical protein
VLITGNQHIVNFFGGVPFQEQIFHHCLNSFAVKSPMFCAIFTSDLQQTLNNQATIMKFRSDMYKIIKFDVIKKYY